MKKALSTSLALFSFGATLQAGVLLDDHFTLGNRTTQNLTNSSAWFANGSGATLTNPPGAMAGLVPGSSCMWLTYFMPPGNPSALNIGDTIKVSMEFSNLNVSANGNATTGFRLGLFNYSAGGTRITADGFSTSGANGANVQGYSTFMNFGETNGIANPLSIRKRTILDANLLGAAGNYTSLGAGGGAVGDPGLSNNVPYTFECSVTRTGPDSVVITNRVFGPGLNMEASAEDASGAYTNFDSFAIRPANAVGCASNIIFTRFRVDGPAGLLTPPNITTEPQSMTLTVSDFGIFSAAAGGSLPHRYQWYFTDTSTPLPGQTNQDLVVLNIQSSQAGQYFMIVTNSQGSATTAVATLTVNTPVHSPRGLILDDTFQNSSRIAPVTPTTSDWLAAVGTTLTQPGIPGPLVGTPQTNTSSMWVANFIAPSASDPVDLAPGDALRVTMTFIPTNPAPLNAGTLRFGIFDFYDGATVLLDDGDVSLPPWTPNGAGSNVRGYMLTVNFGTAFSDDTPLSLLVRNNLGSAGLLSAAADFLSLGSGPSGLENAPAFLSGEQYTLRLTAARVAETNMQVTASITGPQLNNLGFLANDTTYFTHRFSGFAIRPNRTTDSAEFFSITQFKAEIIAATNVVPPFSITASGSPAPNTFFLTWGSVPGKFYQVLSAPSLNSATWVTNDSLVASGTSTSWTNDTAGTAAFYRILAPPQP